ncbi:hypothetical protein Vadar_002768 [Vaccinium darrowii]|uniref:Uncharacterized protein n=1 Tax=Vaccinium darrowii TaxID=229202 RepID=A0ACB7YSZ5_9ERIC|nr:hypothetical protein Vadar_002768 [Vaccinium darrowii]
MKMRNKGKVYPSPSSSSSSSIISSSIPTTDSLSILNLLPAAILALVSILSLEDREVFAYMITRSMKSANPPSTMITQEEEKKKKINKKLNTNNTHKPPVFNCDCFDCYTSYWFRWDSSLNRELIHQAIEAFEDHLATGEQSNKRTNSKGKRRERMGRRGNQKQLDVLDEKESCTAAQVDDESFVVEIKGGPPDKSEDGRGEEDEVKEEVALPPALAVVVRSMAENNHRGLARKVLPDVVGLLNSRLWSLWSPNV